MFEDYGPVLSVKDVCDALMVGKRTVYDLISSHKISAFRTGNTWKITKESLTDYILRESSLDQ